MAGDRDWEKELAKIDKQLGSLSDEALVGPTAVTPPAKGGKPVKAAAPAATAPSSAQRRSSSAAREPGPCTRGSRWPSRLARR